MQPDFLNDAEEWFIHAETDLSIAKVSLETSPIVGAGVAYHAQQAAEKSFKGFLAAYGQPYPKTHDLEEILKLCSEIEPTVPTLHQRGANLESLCRRVPLPWLATTSD